MSATRFFIASCHCVSRVVVSLLLESLVDDTFMSLMSFIDSKQRDMKRKRHYFSFSFNDREKGSERSSERKPEKEKSYFFHKNITDTFERKDN